MPTTAARSRRGDKGGTPAVPGKCRGERRKVAGGHDRAWTTEPRRWGRVGWFNGLHAIFVWGQS